MQIASIAFISLQLIKTDSIDRVNDNFMFIQASNGYIPIVFTMSYISLYGRRSWYLLSLSFCCLLLASITQGLVTFIMISFTSSYNVAFSSDFPEQKAVSCGGNSVKDILSLWCQHQISIPVQATLPVGWIWTTWATCVSWFLVCGILMVYSKISRQGKSRLRKLAKHLGQIPVVLFILSWTSSFTYLFYAYVLYLARSEIATQSWSFGQVVAITVWVPCLAEYIYLERRKRNQPSSYLTSTK